MKRQWLELPDVGAVTASAVTPGTRSRASITLKPAGADGVGSVTTLMEVDFDFFEAFGIDIVAGRSFAEGRGDRQAVEPGTSPPSPTSYILSELAVDRLGWIPDDAIGRLVDAAGRPGVVVGVARDVHLESVRDVLTPVAYRVSPQTVALRQASVRTTGRNIERTLANLDAVWREFMPDYPVRRRFLDQDFDALYRGEQRQGQMFTFFSLISVVIACLGLLGLTSSATTRRTKEIGIRKALGASVRDIVLLFTVEVSLLAIIANLIAWPLAYFLMQRWLAGFAYRINLGAHSFIASAALALVVASLTVAMVARRAARAKPSEALRYE